MCQLATAERANDESHNGRLVAVFPNRNAPAAMMVVYRFMGVLAPLGIPILNGHFEQNKTLLRRT
jgi:hypothetical protein